MSLRPAPLPLPLSELPEAVRRFCDPAAPGPARMMAARGMVPLKGGDLLTVLSQLAADPASEIASAAASAIDKMPEAVIGPALEATTHPSVLDALAERLIGLEMRARIVRNPATAIGTIVFLANLADEALCERIALNEQRLLEGPSIIEALYRNKNTRMSTVDRIVDLAGRNGIEIDSLPTFKDHVEALQDQLIMEATDDALPSDAMFNDALSEDDDDPNIVESVDEDGNEKLKKKMLPVQMRIAEMNKAEKLRFAMIGGASARAILVRDRDRGVAMAAVQAPAFTADEAYNVALSKDAPEEVLRFIGNKKEWARSYELKRALVFNSKTPVGISMKFVSHLTDNDVKTLSKSKNVPQAIRATAIQRVVKKTPGSKE